MLRVVADDFGVNAARNGGILEGSGMLSHASLILNGAAVGEAVEAASTLQITLGLHFNITEGAPLPGTTCRSSPLLERSTGKFLGKAKLFRLLHGEEVVGHRDLLADAILEQLDLQVRRFVFVTGADEVILDGHHHVQVIPLVCDVLCAFFARSTSIRLKYLRIPHDPSLPEVERTFFATDADCFGWPFWLRVSMLAARIPRLATVSPLSHAMIGFDLMGVAMTADALRSKLQALPPNVHRVELMTHIGHPFTDGAAGDDEFWADDFSRDQARGEELGFILSEAFREVLHDSQFSLVAGFEKKW